MANPWAEHGLSLTVSSPCGGKQGSALGLELLQCSCLLGHTNAGEHQTLKGSSSPPLWPPSRALGKDSQALGRAGSSRRTGSTMIFQSRFGPSGASKATLQSSVAAAGMWRIPAASHRCRGHPRVRSEDHGREGCARPCLRAPAAGASSSSLWLHAGSSLPGLGVQEAPGAGAVRSCPFLPE